MPHRKDRRMTSQRRIILEEITNLSSHPTAQDIHALVRRKLPRISLGTVYRNLDLLCGMGLVRKLVTESGVQSRYDGKTAIHTHVHCVECGRLEDLPLDPETALTTLAGRRTDFKIIECWLDFRGVCPKCQRRPLRTAGRLARGKGRPSGNEAP